MSLDSRQRQKPSDEEDHIELIDLLHLCPSIAVRTELSWVIYVSTERVCQHRVLKTGRGSERLEIQVH